jgi:hypothetical protein
MRRLSPNHSPKSIKRQRSLQNGFQIDSSDHSTVAPQMGQVTVVGIDLEAGAVIKTRSRLA